MFVKNFFIENWQAISVLFAGTGGGGVIGYVVSSKTREVELHTKVFKMNSEMIDAVKADFEDHIKFFRVTVKELTDMVSEQRETILFLQKDRDKYKKQAFENEA